MKKVKKETKAPKKKAAVVKESRLNVNNLLIVVVGLLVIMSAIQIFQFQKLTEAVSNGTLKISGQTSGAGKSGTGLKKQEGGCG